MRVAVKKKVARKRKRMKIQEVKRVWWILTRMLKKKVSSCSSKCPGLTLFDVFTV